MRINTIVQASADVVTIISLKAGDVYRRLEKVSYGDKYEAHFGVVQSVDNNGDDTMITALEWSYEYESAKVKSRVFGTDSDVKLFAATADEFRAHLLNVSAAHKRAVKQAADRLGELGRLADELDRIVEAADSLTTTETETRAIGS